jgi:hypothetical protein
METDSNLGDNLGNDLASIDNEPADLEANLLPY